MVQTGAYYPTPHHAAAAGAVVNFFQQQPGVHAVILTCSCARGKASPDSCLDMAVLIDPDRRDALSAAWDARHASEPLFRALEASGAYTNVEVDFFDGHFQPGYHGFTSGADGFELEIGNFLVYSHPLWTTGDALTHLKAQWLPYYDETLRAERLKTTLYYCHNNLDHIPLYLPRGLYFQSFQRLWQAFGEFLQALFISRRVYPIAYDKWIREQIEDILGLPDLYAQLPRLFEISNFESSEIGDKAARLKALIREYIEEPAHA